MNTYLKMLLPLLIFAALVSGCRSRAPLDRRVPLARNASPVISVVEAAWVEDEVPAPEVKEVAVAEEPTVLDEEAVAREEAVNADMATEVMETIELDDLTQEEWDGDWEVPVTEFEGVPEAEGDLTISPDAATPEWPVENAEEVAADVVYPEETREWEPIDIDLAVSVPLSEDAMNTGGAPEVPVEKDDLFMENIFTPLEALDEEMQWEDMPGVNESEPVGEDLLPAAEAYLPATDDIESFDADFEEILLAE